VEKALAFYRKRALSGRFAQNPVDIVVEFALMFLVFHLQKIG
jgi:hypothetical protein